MKKKPKPKKPADLFLKVRSYPGAAWVSVWLVHRDGAAEAGLLWGECIAKSVDMIAAATGLRVETEESPLENVKPIGMEKAKLATVEEQRTLFS